MSSAPGPQAYPCHSYLRAHVRHRIARFSAGSTASPLPRGRMTEPWSWAPAGYLARTSPQTDEAPASFSGPAQADMVAPVVTTLSINSTRCP